MTALATAATLRRRDPSWDFAGEATKRLTHALHPYPAMMIPQVAARLVASLSRPGGVVLDPFSGSGSVVLEAVAAGRGAIGIDLNPLAVLIARAKTTRLSEDALADAFGGIDRRLPALMAAPPPPPPVPRLEFWFKPAVIPALSALREAVLAVDGPARDVALVTLSEVIRFSSNTRASEFKLYRYEPERLARHNPDPLARFRERADRNRTLVAALPPLAPARICLADSRIPLPGLAAGSVDAVITSPPYGDSRTTVAYGQFSRLSAQWLGLAGDRDLDRLLLGGAPAAGSSRPASPSLDAALDAIASRDGGRAAEVERFYVDLIPCLAEIARVLRPGASAALVVGNRRVKDVQIPTDLILADLAAPFGLAAREVIVRRIPTKRMPSRNSPSNVPGAVAETMSHEFILLLDRA